MYEGFGKLEKMVHNALAECMVTSDDKLQSEWFIVPYEELINIVDEFVASEH